MDMSNRPWSARQSWAFYRAILPAGAGITMLVVSLLPWLIDPSGPRLTAWQLPIELGWQLHAGVFNYGLLCLGCTLYTLWIAYKSWLSIATDGKIYEVRRHQMIAAMLCLIPPLLFLFQYLVCDMGSIAELSRNEIQLTLLQSHYGYHSAEQFVPIILFEFHPLHFSGRLALITDQVHTGFFLSFISTIFLLSSRAFLPKVRTQINEQKENKHHSRVLIIMAVILGAALLRAPLALVANYEAGHLLNIGDYNGVLHWSDIAQFLNPSLDQLSEFHLERGEALYYLHPSQLTAESQAYLAAYYLQQKDSLYAYQELQNSMSRYPHTAWFVDEASQALMQLVEMTKPLSGAQTTIIRHEDPSLIWLRQLVTIDPSNVYAHYMIGRILYDFHSYSQCEAEMQIVLNLNQISDVRSSAYTYMSLSKTGLGDYAAAREYLFQAQQLDTTYRNNTARQQLSGMR